MSTVDLWTVIVIYQNENMGPVAEKIIKKLKKQGYKRVHLSEDKPNKIYHSHFHFTENIIVVLKGTMRVAMKNNTETYENGEVILIPKGTRHHATVGKDGCVYIFGQK